MANMKMCRYEDGRYEDVTSGRYDDVQIADMKMCRYEDGRYQ